MAVRNAAFFFFFPRTLDCLFIQNTEKLTIKLNCASIQGGGEGEVLA